MPGDFNLKHIVGDDVGGQSAQTLTATATHPNQQHVATWLPDYTHHSTHWKEKAMVTR